MIPNLIQLTIGITNGNINNANIDKQIQLVFEADARWVQNEEFINYR